MESRVGGGVCVTPSGLGGFLGGFPKALPWENVFCPVGTDCSMVAVSQGRRRTATLGLGTKSRWDLLGAGAFACGGSQLAFRGGDRAGISPRRRNLRGDGGRLAPASELDGESGGSHSQGPDITLFRLSRPVTGVTPAT